MLDRQLKKGITLQAHSLTWSILLEFKRVILVLEMKVANVLISIPIQFLFKSLASTSVVPPPTNGSLIKYLGFVNFFIASLTNKGENQAG